MTMVGKTLVGLTAVALMAAGPAFASPEVEKELAEMRELVEGLKQKVDAQEEQIEHQGGLLEDAQKVVRQQQQEEAAESALSEYWSAVDVNLSAAGSYAYNFNNPQAGAVQPGGFGNSAGGGVPFYPFHSDHNSFQVDQVWLDIGKAPTDESRGGFQFSVLYGNTATFLGQGSSTFGRTAGLGSDSASDMYIHQAYVSWLAPVGEGIQVDAGKFSTLIGAETANAAENWNITRGNVYQLFQPIDHTGVMASTSIGPVSLATAVVNNGGLGVGAPDFNKEKTYIGQIGFSVADVSTAVSVLYGADGTVGAPNNAPVAGDNEQDYGLVDVVASYEGSGFQAWVNADYAWVESSAASAWGVAVAGRVPLTDVLSAAVRLEYARDFQSQSIGGRAPLGQFGLVGARHSDIYGATGTLAYELAENLTLKSEVRWDLVHETSPPGTADAFASNSTGGNRSQIVALGQMVYAF